MKNPTIVGPVKIWNSTMRLPFSIKWIYLIERRNFDQKCKFSNKNDMVRAWRNFQKHSCGICTYDNWNFKPQISPMFHFDRASDGWMAHVLGVNIVKKYKALGNYGQYWMEWNTFLWSPIRILKCQELNEIFPQKFGNVENVSWNIG